MTGRNQFVGSYDGRQIRSGTGSVSVTASRSGSVTVTFSPAFATAPVVVACAEDTSYNVAVFGRSATQVQIFVNHVDGSVLTTSVAVDWIAIAG